MKCVRLLRKMSDVEGSKRGMVIRVSDQEAARLYEEKVGEFETRSAWKKKGRHRIEGGTIVSGVEDFS